jgi:predicted amidohydrolase YtcJ
MSRTLIQDALCYEPRDGSRRRGSLLLEGGRIAALLPPDAPPPANTQAWPAEGAFLMPAFHDAHTHFWMGGEFLDALDAGPLHHGAELCQALAAHADRCRSRGDRFRRSGWILGFGLHQGMALPTLAELDEATGEVPLFLETHDLHSVLVNSVVLGLAGITEHTPDPPGGWIERDDRGRPTGLLRENGVDLVRGLKPEPAQTEIEGAILRAQDYAFSLGITAVDENIRLFLLPAYRELASSGRLKVAVHGWLIDSNLGPAVFEHRPFETGRLKVDTLKLFSDGALGSRSAAVDLPYLDGTRGDFVAPPERIAAFMQRAAREGWRLAVHAIGDRAVDRILSIYEELDHAGLPVRGMRHRIEHAQMIRPGDVARFARLGIVPSLQPVHCAADQDGMEERLCATGIARSFIWKGLDGPGVRLPLGSDWPVESLDPRLTLCHGQNRLSFRGRSLLAADQALGLDRLLAGLSCDAAWAAGWESRRGGLEPGMDADLVLLARDPATLAPEQLPALPVSATWCQGEQVHGLPRA